MKTRLSGKFWLILTVFSLMGQVAWVVENMYFNVFIYNMFKASAADIASMVAASAVAATLTTVFMGALSDRIGKRKIFICGGYIMWGISILAFTLVNVDFISKFVPLIQAASVGVSLTIILDCVMTFFGSTANDAAFNAWLTDSTDNTNRGAAEGINAMMPLVAILVVFGGFMAFDLTKSGSWTVIFTAIGVLTLAVGIMGCFVIKDNQNIAPSESGYLQNIFYGFRLSTIKGNASLYKYLGIFVVFNIAIQIFMPYLIIYYEKTLGMADYVLIMAPAIIIASVVTAFWGRFYDKKGFLTSAFISMAWLIVGFIMLYLFTSKALVFIGSLFMMCGYLSGMAVFGAVIRDKTPEGKSGRLQGIRIFAQVLLPGVIGPYIGKTVLKNAEILINNDGTESFLPNRNIFLAALMVAVIVVILVALFRKKGEKA